MDNNKIDQALKRFLAKNKQKAMGDAQPQMEQNITQNVVNQLTPMMEKMHNSTVTKDEMLSAIKGIQINVPEAKMPQITVPEVHVPTPQVTVNVPKADTPTVNVPAPVVNFPDSMKLSGIDKKSPLPVMMMDVNGKPMAFSSGGAGGGRGDFFTIKDIQNSSGSSIIDNDGFVRVTGSFSVAASNNSTQAIDSSNNPYSQANPFPVVFSSSATTASNIVDSSGVAYSGSNPVPVVFGASATQAVNLVDSSGVAYSGSNAVPTTIVTSATASLNASLIDSSGIGYSGSNPVPITGNIGTVTTVTGVTNSIASSLIDSTGVQYSGSNPVPMTWVSGAGATIGAANIDSSGVQYSGSNPFPITGTVIVSSVTASVASALVDSGGGQYSTSNPVPVTLANTGSTQNVNLIGGGSDSMFVYQAHTANPTAVSDGADVRPMADKLGRQVTRNVTVRDLILTARASIVTGTEVTLLTAAAGTFADCVSVMCANSSSNAVTVDFRALVAGNIEFSVTVPANSTAGIVHNPPWPMSNTGNAWTADLSDDTQSIVINALFSKEI